MTVSRLRLRIIASACSLISALHVAHAAGAPATVEVDAREVSRGIERVHLVLPVKPGNLTLMYPKWLPGEHQANGPVGALSALKFSVDGHAIEWRRDSVEMYAFHLAIPAKASSLDVAFEVVASTGAENPPNSVRTSTESLAIILWNQLVFYPAGAQSDDLQYAATLRLPTGWQFGTALPAAETTGDTTRFKAVSLTTLIDSPLLTGTHFRTVELGGTPAVYLHLAADSAAALEITPITVMQFRKLVSEATALFGATHYDSYHFLWTLSDQIGAEGIEHHQSSDNRLAERALIDEDLRHSWDTSTLLPHEYTHSWNGKFRRPAGLATGNYDTPMRGDLLWVYEGLTEYLGMVLAARSGLASPDDARDSWANVAAWLQTRKGRDWRSLADTAVGAPISYSQGSEWRPRTRGVDFYDESAMLWLEADTLIRKNSNGAKSLDDFCKLFHGAPSTSPKVVPYEFKEVVKALNTVLLYDWNTFWSDRLNRVRAEAPLEGLAASGWHLAFKAAPTAIGKGDEAISKRSNYLYSLGFVLRDTTTTFTEIVPGSPVDLAGVAPGSQLIAVDGRKYSKEVLQDALKTRSTESRVIQFLVQKDDTFKTLDVHYAGQARYATLERDTSAPDILTSILSPHSTAAEHSAN